MRARPNLSGDRLVQDYLARLAAAARHLPKGARMAFVGRTKAQIERQVAAAGTDDPGKVMEILAALGEPEELVREERLRIDSKWLKKRGRDEDPVSAAPATAPSKPRVYQPRVHRRLNSRWRPAAPPPRKPGAQLCGRAGRHADRNGKRRGAPKLRRHRPWIHRPRAHRACGHRPRNHRARIHRARTGGPRARGPHAREPDPAGPTPANPTPWPGDLDAMMPPGPAPGEGGAAPGPQTPLDGIWELAAGTCWRASPSS